ncbi:MAG: CRISPR-associated RAMP protein [Epulopiscium sp.]|nr:CRISPR-associated RAMP protein [Candidatus Epulonipiscium sp.]
MLLHKFSNKYIIQGTLYAKTPIHIGSGKENFDPVLADNGVVRNHKGEPFLPGSSLKGVIRSYIERILKSEVYKDFRSCLIVNDPCISDEKIKTIKIEQLNPEDEAEKIYGKLCDVCQLFGCNHFASKLQIRDANLKSGENVYIDMRNGVAIDRDTGTAAHGKNYDFECVSAGTRFDFYMSADNIEEKHEGILKLIVSMLRNGEIRVGGKTSGGLGSIELQDYKVCKITTDNIRTYLEKGLEAIEEEKGW